MCFPWRKHPGASCTPSPPVASSLRPGDGGGDAPIGPPRRRRPPTRRRGGDSHRRRRRRPGPTCKPRCRGRGPPRPVRELPAQRRRRGATSPTLTGTVVSLGGRTSRGATDAPEAFQCRGILHVALGLPPAMPMRPEGVAPIAVPSPATWHRSRARHPPKALPPPLLWRRGPTRPRLHRSPRPRGGAHDPHHAGVASGESQHVRPRSSHRMISSDCRGGTESCRVARVCPEGLSGRLSVW